MILQTRIYYMYINQITATGDMMCLHCAPPYMYIRIYPHRNNTQYHCIKYTNLMLQALLLHPPLQCVQLQSETEIGFLLHVAGRLRVRKGLTSMQKCKITPARV